jgi:hypothetical protein
MIRRSSDGKPLVIVLMKLARNEGVRVGECKQVEVTRLFAREDFVNEGGGQMCVVGCHPLG